MLFRIYITKRAGTHWPAHLHSSQPDALVPHQAFIKEFKIRYYDRDYRAEYAEGRKPNVVYR